MSQSNPTEAELIRYAEEFILHGDKSKAFRAAFPKTKAKAKTIHENACKFHKMAKVLPRIEELREKISDDSEQQALFTIEKAFEELEEARQLAMKTAQTSAAVSASMGKAKIAGLLVDKVEADVNGKFVVSSKPLNSEEWLKQTQR